MGSDEFDNGAKNFLSPDVNTCKQRSLTWSMELTNSSVTSTESAVLRRPIHRWAQCRACFSQLLEETEHVCGCGQEIVDCGEPGLEEGMTPADVSLPCAVVRELTL